jgi:hypothetical protein
MSNVAAAEHPNPNGSGRYDERGPRTEDAGYFGLYVQCRKTVTPPGAVRKGRMSKTVADTVTACLTDRAG